MSLEVRQEDCRNCGGIPALTGKEYHTRDLFEWVMLYPDGGSMKVEGACHCGEIAYQAEVDPNTVGICHCTDCQTLTGSAYRANIPAPAGSFVLLRGEPKIYVKTAESGAKRAHAFCGHCGTPIYAAALENTTTYSLRVGTIKQRALLRPRRQIWCRSALPWSLDLSGIERLDRQ